MAPSDEGHRGSRSAMKELIVILASSILLCIHTTTVVQASTRARLRYMARLQKMTRMQFIHTRDTSYYAY